MALVARLIFFRVSKSAIVLSLSEELTIIGFESSASRGKSFADPAPRSALEYES
jgi:hypothetical protein